MKLGPKSPAARALAGRPVGRWPKPGKCRICLEETDLTDGICTDREACEARVEPLFTEEECR